MELDRTGSYSLLDPPALSNSASVLVLHENFAMFQRMNACCREVNRIWARACREKNCMLGMFDREVERSLPV